ncbi:MAG: hypothetical protein AAGB48_08155 [Planctomycetota bacterium]
MDRRGAAQLVFVWLALLPAGAALAQPAATEFLQLGGSPVQEARPLGVTAEEPAGAGSIAQTIAALAGVIALAVVCAAGYRWVSNSAGGMAGRLHTARSPAGVIDLLGRYPLSRGQTLLLLKLDSRVLLLAQTAGARVGAPPTIRTLCEVTEPDEVAGILARTATGDKSFEAEISKFTRGAAPVSEPVPTRRGRSAARDGIEVVDLTRAGGPLARLTGRLGGRG